MVLADAARSRPLVFLFGLAVVSLLGLLLLPPVPQLQSYHLFADERTLFGVPNFWNVVSNLPFILIGAIGVLRVRGSTSATIIFLSIFMTGFGSSYYHWYPDDAALFWDRLPMAIGFMAILAYLIEERIDAQVGAKLLWPLIALGVASLLLWRSTDDLRLYVWVQFFPCLVLPLVFWMFPSRHTGTLLWLAAAGLYALAKLLEYSDAAIYSGARVLSGHTFKHLVAAGACYAILRAFQTRRPIT